MSSFSITLGTPVRSAWSGLFAYDLVGAADVAQLNLFSGFTRQRQLEVAIDDLVERFGTNVVCRADVLNTPPGMRLAPTLDFLDD